MIEFDVHMNNKAVELLHFGYPGEAIDVLRLTLSRLKESFNESTSSTPPITDVPVSLQQGDLNRLHDSSCSLMDYSSSEESEESGDEFFAGEKLPIQSVPIMLDDSAHGSPFLTEGYLTLYDRALMLSSTETDRELVSAVVLFNMGLINHSRGVLRGKSHCLSRALELYKMSLHLYQKSKSDSYMDNLVLAILNNSAHIYSETCAFDEMHQCLNCMMDVLEETGDFDEDYSIFQLNSTVCTETVRLHAAAA